MSLDTLYQHILLTEQQAFANSRQLHEVKSAITKAEAKIKYFTENLEHARTELEEKTRLESEMRLQLGLIKRQQQELKKKKEDLLEQLNELREEMEQINREAAEETEKFMKVIRTFSSVYNLLTKREVVFKSQTRAKIQSLEEEAEALTTEIERMKQENPQLVALRAEQESLTAELQGLRSHLADLERELEEALALTESLKAERQAAIQKPQTDSTCLRNPEQRTNVDELDIVDHNGFQGCDPYRL